VGTSTTRWFRWIRVFPDAGSDRTSQIRWLIMRNVCYLGEIFNCPAQRNAIELKGHRSVEIVSVIVGFGSHFMLDGVFI